jgi:hypothetical protein
VLLDVFVHGESGKPDCACTVWRMHSAFPDAHLIIRFKQINQLTGLNHHHSKLKVNEADTPTVESRLHDAGHPSQWLRCFVRSLPDEWRAAGSHHLQINHSWLQKHSGIYSKHVGLRKLQNLLSVCACFKVAGRVSAW